MTDEYGEATEADGVDREEGSAVASATDVEDIARAIQVTDSEWQSGVTVELGGELRWRPDLTKPATAVLHVHLADRLRGYVLERLTAAASAGLQPHIALPIAALY